jgi:cell division protein FtsB
MSARAEAPDRARLRLTPRAAVLVGIVLLLATATVVPLRQYLAQQARMDTLERRVDALQEERQQLQRELELLHDPAYLEELARKCLGMVRPGEISFVTVPEGGKPRPARC